MEIISILLGIIFWPAIIIVWFFYIKQSKPAKSVRYTGTLLFIGLPLLGALSLGHYLFLDEPLVGAVREENVAEVKSLLKWGASADAEFKGSPALEQAADHGNKEIVRLLLAHGARTDTVNSSTQQTALSSARLNGFTEIVKMLKQAGATH